MPFYQPEWNESTPSENNNMEIVPVIASFNTAGTIKPLYVRIHNHSLPITACWFQEESLIIKYHCTVQLGGYTRNIILIYHPSHSYWTVGKDVL